MSMHEESKERFEEFLNEIHSYSTDELKEKIEIVSSEITQHEKNEDLVSIFKLIRGIIEDEIAKRNKINPMEQQAV